MLTKSTTGPFIDSGADFGLGDRPAWRGRVYFSKDEVREMAEQLGLFDEERALAAESILEAQLELSILVEKKDADETLAYAEGYRAGRAQNFDHLADELVDRMRDRVRRPAADVEVTEGAGEDDSAAAPAAEPVAVAPIVEDASGVQLPVGADKPEARTPSLTSD
jgi:hypothetical protein